MTQYKIEKGVMKSKETSNIKVEELLILLDDRVKIAICIGGVVMTVGTKETETVKLYSQDLIDSVVMFDFMSININIR